MGALLDKPSLVFLLLIVVILLFGAKRLPDAARGVGRSLRIFKAETEGLRSDGAPATDDAAKTAPPAVTATGAPDVQAPAPAPAPAPAAAPAPAPAPAPAAAPAPRYLVDPVTGETVLAQPVTPPADGVPRV